ncbi:hypothetical protein [Xenorhabdus sp. SGI246]|uniref:hypothetical protein n=1 Tax=Xenorhabdus sp. SGI246 TaxID=3158263 RepID=UPI00349F798D
MLDVTLANQTTVVTHQTNHVPVIVYRNQRVWTELGASRHYLNCSSWLFKT